MTNGSRETLNDHNLQENLKKTPDWNDHIIDKEPELAQASTVSCWRWEFRAVRAKMCIF